MLQAAQVFAEQAKAAGVTVKVNQVPVGTFYGPNYLEWTFDRTSGVTART